RCGMRKNSDAALIARRVSTLRLYRRTAETVEIVIGIICSVGLGAALLAFQTKINTTIENTGKAIDTVFKNLSEGVE
ncbi:MAG: hypothetical protein ACI36Y_09660, partial [Coriobacteriales bacterium]